jgi:hypothetical protein
MEFRMNYFHLERVQQQPECKDATATHENQNRIDGELHDKPGRKSREIAQGFVSFQIELPQKSSRRMTETTKACNLLQQATVLTKETAIVIDPNSSHCGNLKRAPRHLEA